MSTSQRGYVIGVARFASALCAIAAVAIGAFAPLALRAQVGSQLPPGLPPGIKTFPKPEAPKSLDERMVERNSRATRSLGYFKCLQGAIIAGRRGQLGVIPNNDLVVCIEHAGGWRAVFGGFDGATSKFVVRSQYDLSKGATVMRDAIDTADVAANARSMIRAASAPLPGGPNRRFLPAVLKQKGFYEVWFLPVINGPDQVTIGGDSLIQMSSDGSRELGHSISIPPARTVVVSKGQSFNMLSSELEIPTISELNLAILAFDLVDDVRILTKKYEWWQSKNSGAWRYSARTP